jgi:hypothetical protein
LEKWCEDACRILCALLCARCTLLSRADIFASFQIINFFISINDGCSVIRRAIWGVDP